MWPTSPVEVHWVDPSTAHATSSCRPPGAPRRKTPVSLARNTELWSEVLRVATSSPEKFERDPELYLAATTRPGAKVPHAWLIDETGHRVSTLDVTGKGAFSLVTGLAGQAWVRAADKLDLPFLRTVVVGAKGAEDVYCTWARIREIHEAGALLVRPDGYIAWRQPAAIWDDSDALSQLREALSAVLDACY